MSTTCEVIVGGGILGENCCLQLSSVLPVSGSFHTSYSKLKIDVVKFMLYMFLKLTVKTLAVPLCVDTELEICCTWLAFWRTEF